MELRILHVEDEPQHHLLTRAMLSRAVAAWRYDGMALSLDLLHVTTLAEARMHLRAVDFDVVLLDLELLDVHGTDTLRELRRSAPSVPVVVVSGSLEPHRMMDLLQAGVVDCIEKSQQDPDRLVISLLRAATMAPIRGVGGPPWMGRARTATPHEPHV